jgi:hypothetical protein
LIGRISMTSIAETIRREVTSWPGVEAKPHRFNGVEFRVRGHEIGHLHGGRWVDLPFPVKVRKELVAQGKARLHTSCLRPGGSATPFGARKTSRGRWSYSG